MAREGKSEIVSKKKKDKWIDIYQSFGWELEFTDEMNNGNVKLIFSREKTMPNHARLVELENQYFNLKISSEFIDAGGLGIFCLWGFLFSLFGTIGMMIFPVIGVLLILIGIGLFVLGILLFFRAKKKCKKSKRKREAILNTAKTLL